jgi:hypothetical protein
MLDNRHQAGAQNHQEPVLVSGDRDARQYRKGKSPSLASDHKNRFRRERLRRSEVVEPKESPMTRAVKSSSTEKQKRQAAHIEAGCEKKGLSAESVEALGWAALNKLNGVGKKSGSGRNHP